MKPERRQVHPKKAAKAAAKTFEIEERRETAAKLRLEGNSLRAIAKQLGCSPALVHADLEVVLARVQESTEQLVAQEREISLGRIDVAIGALWKKIEAGNTDAIDRLVKLETRRARLLGLDAPTRSELSGPAGAPVTIDARTDILQRLAGLAASGTPGG